MELNSNLDGGVKMYINRDISKIILDARKMAKVILVTGPRQVGKTTMLQKELGKSYDYVTLDDYDDLQMAKEDPKLFFKQNPLPVMIDEVQYAPEIFRTIKLEVDRKDEKGLIILTGSQAYHLMKHISESLAGRIMIFEMSGLSLRELYNIDFSAPFIPCDDYLNDRKQHIYQYDNLWNKIHRGSLPALQDEDIHWDWYYRDYIKTYIERDIRDLINVKDEMKFYQFLVSLAARAGQVIVCNDIANDVGVNLKTVQSWISILETSGIIHVVQPYFNNILKRAIKSPKLYFMDTGLLCYLVGWNTPKSAMSGAMSGNIFENFVVSEIIKSFINAGADTRNIFYYRDKDKKEIDLVIKNQNTLYPIEIKLESSPRKEWTKNLSVLDKITDMNIARGIVLCQCDKILYLNDKDIAVPIEYI